MKSCIIETIHCSCVMKPMKVSHCLSAAAAKQHSRGVFTRGNSHHFFPPDLAAPRNWRVHSLVDLFSKRDPGPKKKNTHDTDSLVCSLGPQSRLFGEVSCHLINGHSFPWTKNSPASFFHIFFQTPREKKTQRIYSLQIQRLTFKGMGHVS